MKLLIRIFSLGISLVFLVACSEGYYGLPRAGSATIEPAHAAGVPVSHEGMPQQAPVVVTEPNY